MICSKWSKFRWAELEERRVHFILWFTHHMTDPGGGFHGIGEIFLFKPESHVNQAY
jgi:acyl-coenzyme A thioesterase PaaI-like protein